MSLLIRTAFQESHEPIVSKCYAFTHLRTHSQPIHSYYSFVTQICSFLTHDRLISNNITLSIYRIHTYEFILIIEFYNPQASLITIDFTTSVVPVHGCYQESSAMRIFPLSFCTPLNSSTYVVAMSHTSGSFCSRRCSNLFRLIIKLIFSYCRYVQGVCMEY